MRTVTVSLRLFAGAGLFAFGFGCHTPDHSHAVSVGVFDAETHAPVAGAVVHLTTANSKDVGIVDTDGHGVATLTAGDKPPDHMYASVTAAGYLPNTAEVDLPAPGAKPAPSSKVELFAGPSPRVVLTIPAGYAGPVVLTVR